MNESRLTIFHTWNEAQDKGARLTALGIKMVAMEKGLWRAQ